MRTRLPFSLLCLLLPLSCGLPSGDVDGGSDAGDGGGAGGPAQSGGNEPLGELGGGPSETPGTPDTPGESPPPPSAGAVPVGSRVVFTGDYESGDFSQWEQCQNRSTNSRCRTYDGKFYGLTLVGDGQQRQGKFAARYEVRNNDIPNFGGGERSEVSSCGGACVREGDERWYEFSLKFDADFPNPTGNWFIVMQWHSSEGSPPLAIEVNREGMLQLVNNRGAAPAKVIGPVPRGEWADYVLHVKFGRSAENSWAEMFVDGALAVAKHGRSTMSSNENYLKMGIYRDSNHTSTQVVYQDGLRITAP